MGIKLSLFAILFAIAVVSFSIVAAAKTIEVNETEEVNLGIKVSDPDQDQLIISFSQPLDKDGKWQTTYGDAGTYDLTINVSDGELSTIQDVQLIVHKVNVAPEISSANPEQESISIKEGESIDFSVTAADLNKDEMSYSWDVDDVQFGQDASATYNADYGDAGTHTVKATVSDGEQETSASWEVEVEEVDREALLGQLEDITVTETDSVTIPLPDFAAYNLEYAISSPLEGNVWQTGYDDAGIYDVAVTITDRDFKASENIKITVLNNDRPPVVKPIATVWMEENQKVSFEVDAVDPDHEDVSISVESLPDGASFDGKKFTWETNYETVQSDSFLKGLLNKFHALYYPFKIVFTASSNELSTPQTAIIWVKHINRPPVLEAIGPITVEEGEVVTLDPKAADPDGDALKFQFRGWMAGPTYTTTFDDAGAYIVAVTASDGFLSVTKQVKILVNNKNRPPVLQDVPPISVSENQPITFSLKASDPDGEKLSFSFSPKIENATLKDGIFNWVPSFAVAGKQGPVTIPFVFTATDGKEDAEIEAPITVADVNRPPVVKGIKPASESLWVAGKPLVFSVDAADPDGDTLEYLWEFGLFDTYNSTSSLQRTFSTPGTKKVSVTVSDGFEKTGGEWSVKVVPQPSKKKT
ncbi:PKD domain-containing protein [Candidatus Woesearchaeota archaeon]|nr:PKD domain-containing protein [Candidatus Woesearchaeota archaeon]